MLVIRTIKLSGNPLPRLKTLTRVRAGYGTTIIKQINTYVQIRNQAESINNK